MGAAVHNLWPEDLSSPDGPKLPLTILKEQAEALGHMTKNVLRGEVKTAPNENGLFEHRFYIRADLLGGYAYLLLTVTHDANPYPAVVRDASKMKPEFLSRGGRATEECATADDLENALRDIFTSDDSRRVVQSLWQQSKAA